MGLVCGLVDPIYGMGPGCVFLCMEHGLVGPTYMGVGGVWTCGSYTCVPMWIMDLLGPACVFLCGMWTCGSGMCTCSYVECGLMGPVCVSYVERELVGPMSIPLWNVDYDLWVLYFALIGMNW